MSARAAEVARKGHLHPGDALRLVRRRRRKLMDRSRSSKSVSIAIVAAIGIAGVVAAILLEQVVLAQSAFELADLRKDVLAAQERHEDLLLESARLDSSARIERYARETLGMVDPDPASVRYIVADIRGSTRSLRFRRGPSAPSGPGVASSGYVESTSSDAP